MPDAKQPSSLADNPNAQDVADKQRRCPFFRVGCVFAVTCGLLAVAVAWLSWPPRLGIQLAGGTRLVFAIAPDAASGPQQATATNVDFPNLGKALTGRIDPARTHQVIVRPSGERQVEILLGETDPEELQRITERIAASGQLQFRILANDRDHPDVIASAREMAADPALKPSRVVRDKTGLPLGLWVRVAREADARGGVRAFKYAPELDVIRDARTGDLIDLPPDLRAGDGQALARFLHNQGVDDIDVLVATNDGYDVSGADLAMARTYFDELSNPSIEFALTSAGGQRFLGLTGDFSPSQGFTRKLGIILDEQLLSAPTIQSQIGSRGLITGQFTVDEVEQIVAVLRGGRLPVELEEQPVAQAPVPPDGGAARRAGIIAAVGLGMWLVLAVFMLLRYGWFGGAVAIVSLIPAVATQAVLQLLGATFLANSVAVMIGLIGFPLVGNLVLCDCEKRLGCPASDPRAMTAGWFIFMAVLISLFYAAAALCGLAAAAIGTFEVRTAGLEVLVGALTALVIHGILWLLPGLACAVGNAASRN